MPLTLQIFSWIFKVEVIYEQTDHLYSFCWWLVFSLPFLDEKAACGLSVLLHSNIKRILFGTILSSVLLWWALKRLRSLVCSWHVRIWSKSTCQQEFFFVFCRCEYKTFLYSSPTGNFKVIIKEISITYIFLFIKKSWRYFGLFSGRCLVVACTFAHYDSTCLGYILMSSCTL